MEDGTRAEPAPINAFHKSPSAVIGDGDTIVLPDVPATIFEGEAEMALFHPLKFMLATPAEDANEIIARLGAGHGERVPCAHVRLPGW